MTMIRLYKCESELLYLFSMYQQFQHMFKLDITSVDEKHGDCIDTQSNSVFLLTDNSTNLAI